MIRALSQISRQQAALARAAGALWPSLSASAAQTGATVNALRSPAAMSAGFRQLLPAACRSVITEVCRALDLLSLCGSGKQPPEDIKFGDERFFLVKSVISEHCKSQRTLRY